MKVKDGWHILRGYDVYTENDRVLRCVSYIGRDRVPSIPYKRRKSGGWDEAVGVIYSTLANGLDVGRYIIK